MDSSCYGAWTPIIKCKICRRYHDVDAVYNRYRLPFCPVYSFWFDGCPKYVESYYDEFFQMKEIDGAWQELVDSMTPKEEPVIHEYDIRCSQCGRWYLSDCNEAGSCYRCATIKEELT